MMPDKMSVQVNGKTLEVTAGMTVAAAVFLAGETCFRRSISGEPRAALCGMGICMECRVTIDGRPHSRSCQIPVRESMVIRTA